MTNTFASATVTLPNDTTVRIQRSFKAPIALVFRAYTEPALLMKWMIGSDGWEMTRCDIDLRVGGSFRWEWTHSESKMHFGFFGEYLEVEAPYRLSNTETFDPGTLGGDMGKPATTTVTFEDKGGLTTMTTEIMYPDMASRDAALATGMTDGMEKSYTHLDALLPTL